MQGVQAVILIACTILLAPTLGLAAVGWAALAAEVVPCVAVAVVVGWLRMAQAPLSMFAPQLRSELMFAP